MKLAKTGIYAKSLDVTYNKWQTDCYGEERESALKSLKIDLRNSLINTNIYKLLLFVLV